MTQSNDEPRFTVSLTREDIDVLIAALDSHVYWQLADSSYRNDGFVLEPGSDDPETAAAIEAAYALSGLLEAVGR